MALRHATRSAAHYSCKESFGAKLVRIKQEEVLPLPCASGVAHTDVEDEAIRECMRSLENKKRRAELLRHQQELEERSG